MENSLMNEINACDSLFLLYVNDKDSGFELAVTAGRAEKFFEKNSNEECNTVLKSILEDSTPISPDYKFAFRIIFDNPIAYQVTDESFSVWDNKSETECGILFSVLKKSSYLDFIANTTIATALSKSFQHYRICTVEKIIDVIAENNPKIELINIGS